MNGGQNNDTDQHSMGTEAIRQQFVLISDEDFLHSSSDSEDDEIQMKSTRFNIFKGFHVPGKYKTSKDSVQESPRSTIESSDSRCIDKDETTDTTDDTKIDSTVGNVATKSDKEIDTLKGVCTATGLIETDKVDQTAPALVDSIELTNDRKDNVAEDDQPDEWKPSLRDSASFIARSPSHSSNNVESFRHLSQEPKAGNSSDLSNMRSLVLIDEIDDKERMDDLVSETKADSESTGESFHSIHDTMDAQINNHSEGTKKNNENDLILSTENILVTNAKDTVTKSTLDKYEDSVDQEKIPCEEPAQLDDDDVNGSDDSIEIIATGTHHATFCSMKSSVNSEDFDWSFIGRPMIHISTSEIIERTKKDDESKDQTVEKYKVQLTHEVQDTHDDENGNTLLEMSDSKLDETKNEIQTCSESISNEGQKHDNSDSLTRVHTEDHQQIDTMEGTSTGDVVRDTTDDENKDTGTYHSMSVDDADHTTLSKTIDDDIESTKSEEILNEREILERDKDSSLESESTHFETTTVSSQDIDAGKASNDRSLAEHEDGAEVKVQTNQVEGKGSPENISVLSDIEQALPSLPPKSDEVKAYLDKYTNETRQTEHTEYGITGTTQREVNINMEDTTVGKVVNKRTPDAVGDINRNSTAADDIHGVNVMWPPDVNVGASENKDRSDPGDGANDVNRAENLLPNYRVQPPPQAIYSLNHYGQMILTGPSQPQYRPGFNAQPHLLYNQAYGQGMIPKMQYRPIISTQDQRLPTFPSIPGQPVRKNGPIQPPSSPNAGLSIGSAVPHFNPRLPSPRVPTHPGNAHKETSMDPPYYQTRITYPEKNNIYPEIPTSKNRVSASTKAYQQPSNTPTEKQVTHASLSNDRGKSGKPRPIWMSKSKEDVAVVERRTSFVADNGVQVSLLIEDIGKLTVDVVVVAVSHDADLSKAPASHSLLDAAGPELQNEVNRERPKGFTPGDLLVTNGYKANWKHAYLLALPKWKGQGDNVKKMVRSSVAQCLINAAQANVRTIAFGALGCGLLEYPPDVIASMMFDTVIDFDTNRHNGSSLEVRFVVYRPDQSKALQAFKEELEIRLRSYRIQ